MRLPLIAAALIGLVKAAAEFHLSLVADNDGSLDYTLDWVTPTTVKNPSLVYGASETSMNVKAPVLAAGEVEAITGTYVSCWTALLADLKPGSVIYYAVEAPGNASTPQSFTVPDKSFTWAVFGDLGAPVQGRAAGVSIPALKEEVDKGVFHGVLNAGDIAYELVRANGENYMQALEPITSKVPMQATIGNHEHEHAMAPEFALQNYRRRFAGLARGAGAVSGTASSEFYSFNAGLIHFVLINTEVYGDEAFYSPQGDGSWKSDESARRAMAVAQADWLAYDLSRVDRTKHPYVVFCGHRPPFKTPKALAKSGNKFTEEIVPLMSKYQVDLYISGHEHTYAYFEASKYGEFDIPPLIISGSPGNNEFIRSKADIHMEGFTEKTMIPKYGYGHLTATAEALEWKWGSTASDAGKDPKPQSWTLEDEVTIKRRSSASTTTKAGKPVKEPITAKESYQSSGNSSASSGTQDAGTISGPRGSDSVNEVRTAPPASGASQTTTQTWACGSLMVVGISWLLSAN